MRNSGKLKDKNQYLTDGPSHKMQYQDIKSKGMSSLMDYKNAARTGIPKNNFVQAQQLGFSSKPKAANFRDRAAKQFNPQHIFADNTGLNVKSPFLSKTLKGMFS